MTDDQHDQLSLAASPAQGRVEDAADIQPDGEPSTDETGSIGEPSVRTGAKRPRGSRGGRNRKKPSAAGAAGSDDGFDGDDDNESDDDGDTDELTTPESNGHRAEPATTLSSDLAPGDGNGEVELPKRIAEGRA